MHTPLFYKKKSVFGLDIGDSTVKVIELGKTGRQVGVTAYGYTHFDAGAISKGEITQPKLIQQALRPLLEKQLIGELTTDRLAASIPISQTFTRLLSLPKMNDRDLQQAVRLEAEQYIPIPLEDLYLEYDIIHRFFDEEKDEDMFEITVVATPKRIIDSYLNFFDLMNLQVDRVEPSLFAITRSIKFSRPTEHPKVVIDFGAKSSDLAVYDDNVRVISTIATGGDHITQELMKTLGLNEQQATTLKTRYGIGKSRYQQKVVKALQPILTELTEEVQKMMRYYSDRDQTNEDIDGIMLVGGGANMPGLANFLKQLTGMETIMTNPWNNLHVGRIQPPHRLELTLYNTAIGLALEEVES